MYYQNDFTAASLGFSPHTVPGHQSISARARSIWQNRGHPSGNDLAIWLQAEKLLTVEGRTPARSIRQRLRNGYRPIIGTRRSATSL